MASLLRQIVAGPRAKHAETGLDLCYVTSDIIATSGPSQTFPQRAYRNPLDRLVAFLDAKHGDRWAIWEFRAEGTGYPDEAVYNRIRHYPWPDHHPPPFRLVPMILASMRQWLDGAPDRVVVVHCKAGKGRSGTMACSYLIAECGWTPQQALDRFTERRMRPQFGSGVTIPSQLRWVGYVDRWTRHGNPRYADRAVEIVEIHFWGLRHGVKLSVEGYVDEGKKIHVFHTFKNSERFVIEGDAPGGGGLVDLVSDMTSTFGLSGSFGDGGSGSGSKSNLQSGAEDTAKESSSTPKSGGSSADFDPQSHRVNRSKTDDLIAANVSGLSIDAEQLQGKSESTPALATAATFSLPTQQQQQQQQQQPFRYAAYDEPGGQAVIFKPQQPIRVPNSDVNISIERRNKTTASMGLTMVTAVAHVWFNAFFEGNGPEQNGRADDSGIFTLDWDKLDGIKGSSQKGSRAADRLAVVWRAVADTEEQKEEAGHDEEAARVDAALGETGGAVVITPPDEEVPQMRPADWKGDNAEDPDANKHLGLRREDPDSAGVSRASSVQGVPVGDSASNATASEGKDGDDALAGVKTSGPEGEALEEAGQSSTPASSS